MYWVSYIVCALYSVCEYIKISLELVMEMHQSFVKGLTRSHRSMFHLVEVVSRYSDLYMVNTIKLDNEAKFSGQHAVHSTGEHPGVGYSNVHGGTDPLAIEL